MLVPCGPVGPPAPVNSGVRPSAQIHMQYFPNAPRVLVAVLAFVVFLLILHAAFISWSVIGLLWPMLVAALSLNALFGSKKAATILKYLFIFWGAGLLLIALTKPTTTFQLAWNMGTALFYIGSGRYLSKSAAVSKFYENQAKVACSYIVNTRT